jgi:hypothetical protein
VAEKSKTGVEKNKTEKKIEPGLMQAILREVVRAIG